MACEIRSTAARGEVADLERRMYDSRALRAFCCVGSMALMLGARIESCFSCFDVEVLESLVGEYFPKSIRDFG